MRKSLARFRCSSHKFDIETGRYLGIPREDRICRYYFDNFDIRIVEDELHVVLFTQSLKDDKIENIAFFVNETQR